MEPVDKISKLYNNYDILADAQDKVGEHEKEYLEILAAVKGTNPEKRLASQIISRFFKHFPRLSNQAIDAQLDLCEDDDVNIRKQAIKDLPTLCRDNTENLPKIADVLAQLLQSEDSGELTAVNTSFMTLFKIDCKGTLGGLFYQINNGEEVIRDRAIKFVCSKMRSLPDEIMTKQNEDYLLQETKKVLQDVTGDEFIILMNMITSLKLTKTISGQQAVVQMMEELCELDKDFEVADSESTDRLIQCVRIVLPYFSSQIASTRFVDYFCGKVLPVSQELLLLRAVEDSANLQLELLKLLAESTTFTEQLDKDADEKIQTVFNKLLEYMPLPPSDENAENSATTDEPKLEFSYVECLMYTFHQIGKRHPDWLISEDRADTLKDFRLRLQYFARGSQAYVKKLKEALLGKRGDELRTDENRIKVVALKTTTNITSLIRDLFHNPPHYRSTLSLSWNLPLPVPNPTKTASVEKSANNFPVTTTTTTTTTTGFKRKTPITFSDMPVKKAGVAIPTGGPKQDREIYTPPSGKYSNKVKDFSVPQGFGLNRRGRGFGYVRGRGRGRGNWY